MGEKLYYVKFFAIHIGDATIYRFSFIIIKIMDQYIDSFILINKSVNKSIIY
jgi:hypothetical protein